MNWMGSTTTVINRSSCKPNRSMGFVNEIMWIRLIPIPWGRIIGVLSELLGGTVRIAEDGTIDAGYSISSWDSLTHGM